MPQGYMDVPLTPRQRASAPTFQDVPLTPAKRRAPTTGEAIGGKTGAVVDAAIGVAKGLGNTAFGLGKIVRDYTPVGYISDAISPGAFDQPIEDLQPQNTAQRVGFTAEQVGEFFVPGGGVSKLAQVPKAAAITMAQTGRPVDAAVSGAITAVIPGAGTVARLSRGFRQSAEKSAAQALGATKEWAKADAARLAPQMIDRGVKGSRETMLEAAKAQAKQIGASIDTVIADAAAAGTVVDGAIARQAINDAARALTVPSRSGAPIAIEGAQKAIDKLNRLDKFVEKLGPDIPIEHAQRVKQAWDKIVSKAGLYGPKATASATDNADAWAIREAAGSFRKLLADASPDLARLNQEFAFWGGLRNVLKATKERTQAQGGGLISGVTGGTGVITGLATGDGITDSLEKALFYGVAGRQVVKLVQSPWFRTSVSAPLKDALADALASGSTGKVLTAMSKITASVPAQVRAGSQ